MTDKLIKRTNSELRHRPGLNPYEMYPERENVTETETYQREDGSTYTRTRENSRWGGVYAWGEWKVEPARTP